MSIYNYKNPLLKVDMEDIPYEALELFKREKKIFSYKQDIKDIVNWSVIIISIYKYLTLKTILNKFSI